MRDQVDNCAEVSVCVERICSDSRLASALRYWARRRVRCGRTRSPHGAASGLGTPHRAASTEVPTADPVSASCGSGMAHPGFEVNPPTGARGRDRQRATTREVTLRGALRW